MHVYNINVCIYYLYLTNVFRHIINIKKNLNIHDVGRLNACVQEDSTCTFFQYLEKQYNFF